MGRCHVERECPRQGGKRFKVEQKLEARQKNFDDMMNGRNVPRTQHHRPGSMQLRGGK